MAHGFPCQILSAGIASFLRRDTWMATQSCGQQGVSCNFSLLQVFHLIRLADRWHPELWEAGATTAIFYLRANAFRGRDYRTAAISLAYE